MNKSNLNLQTEESFYQKENKTLNVNVLAEESEEMQNNEYTFDSEKFAKSEAKSRPRGTIENNLAGGSPPTGKYNRMTKSIYSSYRILRKGFHDIPLNIGKPWEPNSVPGMENLLKLMGITLGGYSPGGHLANGRSSQNFLSLGTQTGKGENSSNSGENSLGDPKKTN